jgi:hypothetical protein
VKREKDKNKKISSLSTHLPHPTPNRHPPTKSNNKDLLFHIIPHAHHSKPTPISKQNFVE